MPINQRILFTDALQIPALLIEPYQAMARIGFILLSVLLIAAIVHENVQGIKNKSDYAGLFVHVLLVVSLLVFYEQFFSWIVIGFDLIAQAVMPHEDFREVINAFIHQPFDWKFVWNFNMSLTTTALNYLTYTVAVALLGAIMMLRFIVLSFLYVIGPIVISVGIYKATSQGLSAWVKSLIAIGAWNVILSILMKVISAMNLLAIYQADETNFLTILAANVLFIMLFIMVPFLTHQFVSGGGISGLGSIALGGVTALVVRSLAKIPRGASASSHSSEGGSTYK